MAKTTITVLMLLCASAGALSRSRTGIRSTGEDKSATIYQQYAATYQAAGTAALTTTAATFPYPGACATGTYIAASSSAGVADVETCEDDCRGTSTCKYYSYCPAGPQCPAGNAGKCALYSQNSQCGASTRNGIWAGYTSYEISDRAKCSTMTFCTGSMVIDTSKATSDCAGATCAVADVNTCCKAPGWIDSSTISCSGTKHSSGLSCDNTLDGNAATTWHNNGDAADDIIYYEFASPVALDKFKWNCHASWGVGSAINTFDVYASESPGDSGPWTKLSTTPVAGTESCASTDNIFSIQTVPNNVSLVRAVKLHILTNFQYATNYATTIESISFHTAQATDVPTVAAATITGDPHMQNVRGVKQDLLAPGTYNILELPSGKGDSLTLIGDVSYVDHPTFCNPLFLTKLRIIGTALGNQEFKFDLGNSSDAQSFSVTRTNLRTKKSEFFQVSEPIKKQFGPVGLSTAQCKKGQVGENSKNCWDSFNTMALKLLGKDGNFLTVNVRRGGQLGFFDVKVNGLNALGLSVGGLLGTNGFSSLGTSTDKTCHNKRRSKLDSLMEIHRDDVHIQQSLLMAKM